MHHFDVDESLIDELDALIDQFGVSAVAVDFVYALAMTSMPRRKISCVTNRKVVMSTANRGGWKTCSRGHKYRGADPCPVCWPNGATKKRK